MRGEAEPSDRLKAALDETLCKPSEASARSSGSARRSGGARDTYRETLRLHQQGLTVAEIAEKRDLTTRTVSDHLLTLGNRGADLDLETDSDRLEQLREVAADWDHGDRLRPLKDELSDDWSYPVLKRHLAALLLERSRSDGE